MISLERKSYIKILSLAAMIAVLFSSPLSYVFAQGIERLSLTSSALEANDNSASATASADGRYVVFHSDATNLVAGDTNGNADIFLRDTLTDITTRISVSSTSAEAVGGDSLYPSISADGRYVVFQSDATNLITNDTNATRDVFLRDIQLGTTTLVSIEVNGVTGGNGVSSGAKISADGNYVVFESYATDLVPADNNLSRDIFIYDIQANGSPELVSVDTVGILSNGDSSTAAVSADGRYVTFHSEATNLVPADTNNRPDVFLHDTQLDITTRVSVDSQGTQANNSSVGARISANGQYIVFYSSATNLISGDTNGFIDVFLHNTQTGSTTRVSVDSQGQQTNDNSFAFVNISYDGRYVVFESEATNLVNDDTNGDLDIFLHDTQTGDTTRVSVDSQGNEGNDNSYAPYISDDNQFVVFHSDATNLVAGDINGNIDVFMHEIETGSTTSSSQGSISRRRSIHMFTPPQETATCPYFNEYLRLHDRDENKGGIRKQVSLLQEFLIQQGFEKLMPIDGIFGMITRSAVIAWQNHYAQEVLWPWSLFSNKTINTDGYFYKASRRWANMQKGCPESVTLDNGVVLPADTTRLKVFY